MEDNDFESASNEVDGEFSGLVDDLFEEEDLVEKSKKEYEDEQRKFSDDLHGEEQNIVAKAVSMVRYKPKGMYLGHRRDNDLPVDIDSNVLARHAAMLGSTGSGKTVMAKAVIEEATMAGIPSLIIDPQGDLARLILKGDEDVLAQKGGDPSRQNKLMSKQEVRIWTPLRSKGLPLCIDPFHAPPADLDPEEAITAWDMVAAGFANLADYDVEKADGKTIKTYLYEILVQSTRLGLKVNDFESLARVVRDPHHEFTKFLYPECFEEAEEGEEVPEVPPWNIVRGDHELVDFEERLPKTTRGKLARRLSGFQTGVNQLLFSNGVPINIDTLAKSAVPGKVPVNVVYLNTIQDENQKQYFVQELARELYDWMLDQQPAEGELKLLFFMDEVAPYLPPHPRNPPAKDLIKLIFKQARKYGVSCVLATQNVSDVDYKILAQANSTFVGRFTQPQDIDKVRHLLKESGTDLDLVSELPTLQAGEFQVVAPDVDEHPFPIQCRWLYTDHGAPLSEEQVEEHTSDEIRAWARSQSSSSHRDGGGSAAALAATRGAGWNKRGKSTRPPDESVVASARINSLSGVAAAGKGVVDESAFEVRLVGGLSVLRDGRDPLYTMQSAVNLASLVALAWTLVAMLFAWRDSDLEWWWLGIGFVFSSMTGVIIALESFLSHDAELLHRISDFSRAFQVLILGWLWCLLIWSNWGDLNLLGADRFLEVVVVWTSLFFAIDFSQRFKLGRLEWNGETALNKLMGLTAILTKAEISQMRASSSDTLSTIRWILNGITVVWGIILILLFTPDSAIQIDAVSNAYSHVTLWIISIYALMFASETWLRIRGKMPDLDYDFQP